MLVVQAGADAHADDPLADLMLTTYDDEAMLRRVLGWAEMFTGGRVLFTLGGGYSRRATPRIWTMLYLLLHDLPVGGDLPGAWRRRWSGAVERPLPATFHDVARTSLVEDRDATAHRNRDVAQRLLAASRKYWV